MCSRYARFFFFRWLLEASARTQTHASSSSFPFIQSVFFTLFEWGGGVCCMYSLVRRRGGRAKWLYAPDALAYIRGLVSTKIVHTAYVLLLPDATSKLKKDIRWQIWHEPRVAAVYEIYLVKSENEVGGPAAAAADANARFLSGVAFLRIFY